MLWALVSVLSAENPLLRTAPHFASFAQTPSPPASDHPGRASVWVFYHDHNKWSQTSWLNAMQIQCLMVLEVTSQRKSHWAKSKLLAGWILSGGPGGESVSWLCQLLEATNTPCHVAPLLPLQSPSGTNSKFSSGPELPLPFPLFRGPLCLDQTCSDNPGSSPYLKVSWLANVITSGTLIFFHHVTLYIHRFWGLGHRHGSVGGGGGHFSVSFRVFDASWHFAPTHLQCLITWCGGPAEEPGEGENKNFRDLTAFYENVEVI